MAKIYKRGKVWWGRVAYRGKDCRKSLETASASVARQRLLTFVADVKAGKWNDGRRRKFEDAANKFIDEHFPRIKPNTAKRYRVSLMNLHDHLDVVFLDEIDSAVLSDFEVARRKQGVTDTTIRRDLMCLSSLFSCAQEWLWADANPISTFIRRAKKRGLDEAPPRTRFLSHDEETAIFDYIAGKRSSVKGNRDTHAWLMCEAAIACAIDTGLRSDEQFGLELPHLDLKAREVTVSQQRAKSSRLRTVPLFDRTHALLAALPRSGHTKHVFWRTDGRRYRRMYHQLQGIIEDLGIEHVEWHDLRRTCGVRLLRDHHMSIERVSLWLGHSNINITERTYAFLSVDDLHKAVADSPLTRKPHAHLPAQSES